jgi:transcriptional regulator with XRE-family HTH domain
MLERNFKELRAMASMSQYRVSARTGIDRCRISAIENGHVLATPEEQATLEKILLTEIDRRAQEFRAVVAGESPD